LGLLIAPFAFIFGTIGCSSGFPVAVCRPVDKDLRNYVSLINALVNDSPVCGQLTVLEAVMGANSRQAMAVVLLLVGFTLLAGGFAGGGVILWVAALALIAGAAFFFMKSKALEQSE
jgi:hypothetical protein